MAYINSAGSPILDGHPSVTLRAADAAAITASAAEAPIEFDAVKSGAQGGAYWEDNHPGFLGMSTVVKVESADFADGNETYTVTLEVATDQAFTTPVVIGTVPITSIGKHVILVYGPTVDKIAPDAQYIRVNAALGGTTPSLKYSAWITSLQSTIGQ